MNKVWVTMKTDDESTKYGKFEYDQDIKVDEADAKKFVERHIAIYKPKESALKKRKGKDVDNGGE